VPHSPFVYRASALGYQRRSQRPTCPVAATAEHGCRR